MRPQDIKIGETYRHKDHPNYAYAKALQILKPKQGENIHTYAIVKCRYTVQRNEEYGQTKYFRPCDLIKENQ